MGIQDLVSWAKKAHPNSLQAFPKRWASPEIRGKKIAIDATLLTNRFHFAMSLTDAQLKNKGGLIGWYNLISVMRAHGVRPVAIWDKPGHRKWKEPERRRRALTRALNLARRAHELERFDRLSSLRSAFLELSRLSEEEQDMIRQHWEATRFTLPEHDGTGNWTAAKSLLEKPSAAGKAGESDGEGKGKMEGPSNLGDVVMGEKGEDAVDETIDRITSTIDTLTSLVSRYRAHNRPRERGLPETPEVSQAIEHICDLEELSEEIESQALSLPAAATEADAANTPDEGEGEGGAVVKDPVREFVDERIEEVMPNTFAESRRQSDLTVEEGEIIDAFLCRSQSSPPTSPTPPAHLSAGSVDVIVGGEEVSSDTIQITPLSQQPPLDRLDDLILRLPAIQAIYDRALDMPTQQDHADCRELLMRMGVPVIHAEAPYEAEGLASALAREGLVDYVGTEDSDVIAYEGPLLKNLSTAREPLILLSGSNLRALSTLSPEAFLDFCILLGTDASPRIPKLGPAGAFKAIEKHSSIESILREEPNIAERVERMGGGVEGFLEMVRNAREVFGKTPPLPEGLEVEQGEWDEWKLERWLEEIHGIRFVDPRAGAEGEEGDVVEGDEREGSVRWDEVIDEVEARR